MYIIFRSCIPKTIYCRIAFEREKRWHRSQFNSSGHSFNSSGHSFNSSGHSFNSSGHSFNSSGHSFRIYLNMIRSKSFWPKPERIDETIDVLSNSLSSSI
jgi:hypothetical protein